MTHLEVSDDRVTATVDGHVADIRRHTDTASARHVPIGSRDAAHLTMTLDGVPVTLHPGPGRYTRGSYAVNAVLADGTLYELRPTAASNSRLHRDGVRRGDLSPSGAADWAPEASSADRAMGAALVGAFGAGARFFLEAFFEDSAELH